VRAGIQELLSMFRKLFTLLTFLVAAGLLRAAEPAPAEVMPRGTLKIEVGGDAEPSFVFSADGKHLATWGDGSRVELWDAATARPLLTLHGFAGKAASVAFAPDGGAVAVGSRKDVTTYALPEGKRQRLFKGHTWDVQFLAYSPDGKTLTSQSINGNDATLKQWDVATGQESRSVAGRFGFTLAAPDRKTTAFFRYQTVALLDVTTLKEREFPAASLDVVGCAAFSPRGDLLLTGNGTGVFRYDVASGKVGLVHATHTQDVSSVAAAPDGKTIASGSHDGTVVLWDVEKNRARLTIPAHDKGAVLIRYSPDGQILCSASTGEPRVRFWDLASGTELARLEAPARARVFRLQASPDGRALSVLYADGTLKLLDLPPEGGTRP
jgi:WD40 repeat protein